MLTASHTYGSFSVRPCKEFAEFSGCAESLQLVFMYAIDRALSYKSSMSLKALCLQRIVQKKSIRTSWDTKCTCWALDAIPGPVHCGDFRYTEDHQRELTGFSCSAGWGLRCPKDWIFQQVWTKPPDCTAIPDSFLASPTPDYKNHCCWWYSPQLQEPISRILSADPHLRHGLSVSSFYTSGNSDPERLSNLPQVTQGVMGCAGPGFEPRPTSAGPALISFWLCCGNITNTSSDKGSSSQITFLFNV